MRVVSDVETGHRYLDKAKVMLQFSDSVQQHKCVYEEVLPLGSLLFKILHSKFCIFYLCVWVCVCVLACMCGPMAYGAEGSVSAATE